MLKLDENHYNPLNDALFKFVFGKEERKAITIDLLNTFFEEELEHPIVDLTFTQTEMSPDQHKGKESRFDVACTLSTGEKVDIEVQVVDQRNMPRRTLYYWADLYTSGFPRGGRYSDLMPTLTLNILAFELFDHEDPHSVWSVCNLKTHERFNKDMSLHFVEIPKFANLKKPRSELTKMERWMCYFCESLPVEERRKIVMHDPEIVDAMDAAGAFFKNDAERRRYIDSELIRMDRESAMDASREEGREEGREDMIRNALLDLTVSQVSKLLRVPEELVARVASRMGATA